MKPGFAFALIFIFAFQLAAQDTPPRVTYQATPVYPLQMRREGLRGLVQVGFVVDTEGRVRDPIVISSTNPGLNQAAIDAVLKWRFTPGLRAGVPVNVRMSVPISFQLDMSGDEREAFLQNVVYYGGMPGGGSEPYQVSARPIDQSKLPPELRYDIPPKPANTVYAVYPFELLRDHVGGTAEVRFLVSPGGDVGQAIVVKATRPEFGQALLAMLDEWKFQPAMKDGKPMLAVLDVEQEFSDSGGNVPVSDSALNLLHELKKEKPELCPLKDLDTRPQLLSQHPPVFPSALIGKMTEGRAVVEFIIDRDGNVQLPRVVSVTDPAFGYAAVQGVSAWKFAPPTSHGKPVVMRAQIPIEFRGPKPAPAAPPPAQN
jgi:TonB family protein